MKGSVVRLVIVIVASAVIGALITLAVVHPTAKDADEQAPKAPQRVTVENGEPTVNLDAPTQQKIGLATVPVATSQQAPEVQLFGSVIDVQDLAAIQNQVVAARAQLSQVRSKEQYDRMAASRLRTLNADNKNVSDRAVQEAEATLAADGAAASSANAAIQAASSAATQRFGPVLAQALMSQSEEYRDLVSMRRVLVAFALPPGTSPPPRLQVTSPASTTARLLSIAPRVDPRLQGTTYFYVAPGGSLSAGMNVTARFSGGGATSAAVVPREAVVSWQGKSWVYVRRDPAHFSRREISTANAATAGYFVTNLTLGDQVVTTGAQQLLSEEMRAQLHEQ